MQQYDYERNRRRKVLEDQALALKADMDVEVNRARRAGWLYPSLQKIEARYMKQIAPLLNELEALEAARRTEGG